MPDSLPALPEGWWYLEPDHAAFFEAQLRKEVLPGHAVHGKHLRALAKTGANDDVLFVEAGDPPVHWLVHLTYASSTAPPWPQAQAINFPHDLADDS